MKSFEEFFTGDTHNHADFDTQYTCFTAFVGRQRQRGDASAKLFLINQADLRSKYDELLLQRTSGIARKSDSSIVNNSIGAYTDGEKRPHELAFICIHMRRPLKMPLRPPNLTDIQGKLFTFIVSKLPRFQLLKRVQKKDVLYVFSCYKTCRRPW